MKRCTNCAHKINQKFLTGDTLCTRQKGHFCNDIGNNVGVFQGSPLFAQLFIIYDDNVMSKYRQEIKNKLNNIYYVKIRNIFIGAEYFDYMLKQSNNAQYREYMDHTCGGNNPNSSNWVTPNPTNRSELSCDRVIFADDTGIGYNDHSDIPIKLKTYNNTASAYNFLAKCKKCSY